LVLNSTEEGLKKIPDIPVNRNSGMTISGIREWLLLFVSTGYNLRDNPALNPIHINNLLLVPSFV
jgi:hypothetical protein